MSQRILNRKTWSDIIWIKEESTEHVGHITKEVEIIAATVQDGRHSIPGRDVVGRAALSWHVRWPRLPAHFHPEPTLTMHAAVTLLLATTSQ
jgi:hypothetical protein